MSYSPSSFPQPLTSLDPSTAPAFSTSPAPAISGAPYPGGLERPTSLPARRFQNYSDASPLSSLRASRTMMPLNPNMTSLPGPDFVPAWGSGEQLPKFKFANPNSLDWSLLSDLF